MIWLKKIFVVITFMALLLPSVSSAALKIWTPADPLIPCGYDGTDSNTSVDASEQCTYEGALQLVFNITNFAIYAAVLLSVIAFGYAAFLYLTNMGNPGRISTANAIFRDVVIGLIFVLCSWLIVRTILGALLPDDTTVSEYSGLESPAP